MSLTDVMLSTEVMSLTGVLLSMGVVSSREWCPHGSDIPSTGVMSLTEVVLSTEVMPLTGAGPHGRSDAFHRSDVLYGSDVPEEWCPLRE